MTTPHDLAESGNLEDDAKLIYYHRSHGRAWLLNWNYVNPDEDAQYEAFSSESDLRRWVRAELGYAHWLEVYSGLWRGVVRGEQEGSDA